MHGLLKPVLVGGLLSGALDIAAASIAFHANVFRVLQAVAAGIYGRASFTLGTTSMVVGALCQELITVAAALAYCLVAVRKDVLLRHWLVCGLLYGALCNIIVTYGIVPLSHAKITPLWSYPFWMNLAINTALYGTPIAFAARRWITRK
jgi:hypothetical protein